VREQRKVVTVLFADVVGSTAMAAHRDPEVTRSVMTRYFKLVTDIARAYGGTVEKFAGDAAMVVFGVPAVHDDDAERAVRAALDIRDGAGDLEVRLGVNTGEAVTAVTDDRQFMVSGDAVNIAARLQQGADPGEVVVGQLTYQLSRGAIEYQERPRIAAKGKPEPLPAYRALRPLTRMPTQVRGVPGLHAALVGRDRELRMLLDTFARTAGDRSPHLFTIVGAAGIGKSRLVDEALAGVAPSTVRVLRGRCLPYGRGITYWPLVEMVRQDTGITLADERDTALRKLDRWLGELLPGSSERPALRARLAVMLALESAETAMADTPAARVEKEIEWAVRHYIEAAAAGAPLIAVFDDLQWAEPPILSLIEQLAERVADAPLVIVCMARPEFLEAHLGWGAGKANSTTITLAPLSAKETGTLISRLLEVESLPEALRAQIVDRSAGTPLFCEEFIHMLIDERIVVREGHSWKSTTAVQDIRVPEGISAVLSARLDLLPEAERYALQAASVIGQRFTLNQLRELSDGPVEAELDSLRRKGLVGGSDRPDDDYWFRHILIRDAAYSSLPKSNRALLHDRFRHVLEAEVREPEQICEILAHHAERAFMLARELDLDDSVIEERAQHALRWLSSMAERARMRHDIPTFETALDTARDIATVMSTESADRNAGLRLLEGQLAFIKGDYAVAREKADEAAALGERAGLWSVVATARLTDAWIANWTLNASLDRFQAIVDRAIEACRRAGDVPGEIEARHIRSFDRWAVGDVEGFIALNEALIEQARAAGDVAHVAALSARLVPAHHVLGQKEAEARRSAEAAELAEKYGLRNVALRVQMDRAGRTSHEGDFASAEQQLRAFAAAAEEAGAKQHQISALRFLGQMLLYSGEPGKAAEALDRALALSHTTGERWNRTELFALRARAALESGDVEAADRLIEQARTTLRSDDLTAESELNTHLGTIRAAQHRDAEAEAALRRAVDLVANTGFVNTVGPAAFGLAAFLASRGRLEEAESVVQLYEPVIHGRGWHMWDRILARYEAERAKSRHC
jgi:class 3 adenylate cyclase/tetratricopeptide (TPR) repeat protein